jgi:hypothetical protein
MNGEGSQAPAVYVVFVGGRELVLDEEELLSYARRLFIERELGLPRGTLVDDVVGLEP